MPKFSANITLEVNVFDAKDSGQANEILDAFITELAKASEKVQPDITWDSVNAVLLGEAGEPHKDEAGQ